jgi:hypothetical protein
VMFYSSGDRVRTTHATLIAAIAAPTRSIVFITFSLILAFVFSS